MRKLALTCIVLSVMTITMAQNAHLSIIPEKPQTGDTVRITYTGPLAKEGTSLSYFFHYFNESFLKPGQIPLTYANGALTGSFVLSDSALYVALKITNKEEVDNNNNRGFGFNVYENGKLKKGTLFTQGQAILYNDFALKAKVDTLGAIERMEEEYRLHPDLKKATHARYLTALRLDPSRQDDAIRQAENAYNEILKTGENDGDTQHYADVIAGRNQTKSDSLVQAVVDKYPRGMAALKRKLFDIQMAAMFMPEKALEIYDDIQKNFPNISPNMASIINRSLVEAYRNTFDFANFDAGMAKIDDPFFLSREYNEMAWKMALADKDLEMAKTYSEKSLKYVDDILNNSLLPHEYAYNNKANYLDTYAFILSKLGDTQGAVNNETKAAEMVGWKDLGMNENVVQYLINNEQFNDALTKSSQLISGQQSSNRLDSLYKVAYVKFHGNENALDATFSALKNKGNEAYREELKKQMTDIEALDFSLKDINGNTTRLSDLRGSIVVLDFWATWCGPCIRSFPAMQQAMSELKDENVRFLYINTLEDSKSDEKRIENIRQTLEKQNLNFQVLLDESEKDEYKVATAYKVQGIPVKFIIDKAGKLRFRSVGYGGDEKLVNELKAMVEILK